MGDRPVQLAIAGAGHMGARHAAAIRTCESAELVAVWSRTRAHAARLAGEHGARVAESLSALVESFDIDAVIVCTPPAHHAEPALAAFRAGKHVIVEKPLARSISHGERMIEAADAAGLFLMTAHVARHLPLLRTLHDQVLSGAIGEIAMIHMSRETATALSGWRIDPAEGGGVVLHLGIHEFDWLLWTAGPVERVYCRAASRVRDAAAAYALTTLRFRSGAIAEVESSATKGEGFRISGELAGDAGLITYDSDRDVALSTDLEPLGRAEYGGLPTSFTRASPFLEQMEHWMRCLRGQERPLVKPSEALDALRVALAALESARSGQVLPP